MLQRLFRHGFHDTRPVPEGYSRQICDSDGRFGLLRADGSIDYLPTASNAVNPEDFKAGALLVANINALVSPTAEDVTSITLTPGTWEIEGNVTFLGTAATVTVRAAGIHTTTGTLPAADLIAYNSAPTTTSTHTITVPVPRRRVVVTADTQVFYLVGQATFSAGTVGIYGSIQAKRLF